ncbi:hypothetical protein F1559_001126 [Cyanidiococcus yangmingshanensis]|uniref:Uncharacterized protein n=1 Tax=Cyanidiococcus yangmingshanensis TaxID=2690220 RepID=A0A7J7IPW9_9RHOD|nr:hypothetical protein F1559_001126 [Cyanidiococcus yangmingshanensis]
MSSFAELVQRAQRSLAADYAPGRKVFRQILGLVEKPEELEVATQLQKEFHKRFVPLSKPTWSLYIQACMRAQRFDRVLELLRKPDEFGCRGLIATKALRSTVAELHDAGAIEQLREAAHHAQALAPALVSDILRRLVQLDAIEVVLKTLEKCPPRSVRPSHFTMIASVLNKRSDKAAIPQVLELLRNKGLEPNRGLAELARATVQ